MRSTLLPARAGLGGQIFRSDSEDRMAEGGGQGGRGNGGIRRMDGEDERCRERCRDKDTTHHQVGGRKWEAFASLFPQFQ